MNKDKLALPLWFNTNISSWSFGVLKIKLRDEIRTEIKNELYIELYSKLREELLNELLDRLSKERTETDWQQIDNAQIIEID
mgnify:CR=1 FL=1